MTPSVFKDIKDFLYYGNMINKLIVVNLFIGLVYILITIFSGYNSFDHNILKYFLLSSDIVTTIYHPWTLFTHLFFSVGILQFVINMLFLYWFGNIIGDMIGDSKILPLYIYSGLTGAFLYIIYSYLFISGNNVYINGVDSITLGFAVASAVLVPDLTLNLILLGRVRLKIVVIVFITIKILYALSSYNPVYISYIGAILSGWFYIYSMKRGDDLSVSFNSFLNKLINLFSINNTKQNKNLSVRYKSKKSVRSKFKDKQLHDTELNRVLEKIKKTGYDSLTEEEKEFLFLASKKE